MDIYSMENKIFFLTFVKKNNSFTLVEIKKTHFK